MQSTNAFRRACIFVTSNLGETNYLVADVGSTSVDASFDLIRLGSYLFTGSGQRLDVSAIDV